MTAALVVAFCAGIAVGATAVFVACRTWCADLRRARRLQRQGWTR